MLQCPAMWFNVMPCVRRYVMWCDTMLRKAKDQRGNQWVNRVNTSKRQPASLAFGSTSISESTSKWFSQPVTRGVSKSLGQWISESIIQSDNEAGSHIIQSVNVPLIRSINIWISEMVAPISQWVSEPVSQGARESAHRWISQSMNQKMIQSSNKPMRLWIKQLELQSISKWFNESVRPSFDRSATGLINSQNLWSNHPVRHSETVSQWVSQSISQTVNQRDKSIHQVSHSVSHLRNQHTRQETRQPENEPVNQWVSVSTNQSVSQRDTECMTQSTCPSGSQAATESVVSIHRGVSQLVCHQSEISQSTSQWRSRSVYQPNTQPVGQSANQRIDEQRNQGVTHWIGHWSNQSQHSTNQCAVQSFHLSIHVWDYRVISLQDSKPVNQTVGEPVGQPFGESAGQSIN